MTARGRSGRTVDAVTVDAVRAGEVGNDDVRIHPDTLLHQADVAEAHANPQLAANLRRAAELTGLPDADVLRIYESLRPHRCSAEELAEIADWLTAHDAPLNAALVREAREVYVRRGLTR
jgi:propanediol dehydratase small subunit